MWWFFQFYIGWISHLNVCMGFLASLCRFEMVQFDLICLSIMCDLNIRIKKKKCNYHYHIGESYHCNFFLRTVVLYNCIYSSHLSYFLLAIPLKRHKWDVSFSSSTSLPIKKIKGIEKQWRISQFFIYRDLTWEGFAQHKKTAKVLCGELWA